MTTKNYAKRVRYYENLGATTSDAQAIVDAEEDKKMTTKTKTQHTLGPWRVSESRRIADNKIIINVQSDLPNGDKITYADVPYGTKRTMSEAIEIAHLIASAPELLAALKWAQARLFVHEGNSDVYEKASSVIAKAERVKA